VICTNKFDSFLCGRPIFRKSESKNDGSLAVYSVIIRISDKSLHFVKLLQRQMKHESQ
jgi:hypothetical protein